MSAQQEAFADGQGLLYFQHTKGMRNREMQTSQVLYTLFLCLVGIDLYLFGYGNKTAATSFSSEHL